MPGARSCGSDQPFSSTKVRLLRSPPSVRSMRRISESRGSWQELIETIKGDDSFIAMLSSARMWMAWCLAEIGDFLEADSHVREANAAANRTGQSMPILLAHLSDGLVSLRAERFAQAAASLEPALTMSDDPSLKAWRGPVASPLGRSLIELGQIEMAMLFSRASPPRTRIPGRDAMCFAACIWAKPTLPPGASRTPRGSHMKPARLPRCARNGDTKPTPSF
jgi:hypothetical protein